MKSKYITLSILLVVLANTGFAQKFIASESKITFYSYAPIEDIQATNTQVKSIVNVGNGDMVFSVPIKSFVFEKALMQEHFNENYMESDKYPSATFIGKLQKWKQFEGKRNVIASGKLTIHGVSQEVTLYGEMTIDDDEIIIESDFKVKVADHKIKIPKAVFYNIADIIEVHLHMTYKPYGK